MESETHHVNWEYVSFGEKIYHPKFGEGIFCKNYVGLMKVLFKPDKIMTFRWDDKNIKLLEHDF